MNFDKVYENVRNLHKINFTEILSISDYDDDFSLSDKYYDFTEDGNKYKNGRFKSEIKSCCHKCDSCNSIRDDVSKLDFEKYKNFRLENVSHGSHTIDYLHAAGFDETHIISMFREDDWIDTPVLFLMENPSIDYEIYEKVEGKYPAKTWYWIHRKLNKPDYMIHNLDNYLVQGKYGEMVYALICKYKLANAYLTNVIKCGMNNKNDPNFKNEGYLSTWWYKDECKRTCINEILSKEIKMLRDGYSQMKVFAFGSNAYWLAKDYFQNSSSKTLENLDIQLVQLPHPSSRLSNNYRKYVVDGILKDVIYNHKFPLTKNTLPTKEKIHESLVKAFEKKHIEIRTSSGKSFLTEKYVLTNSLFSESQIVTGVTLKGSKDNKILGKIGFGYNFLDEVYWGWDYDKKDYISTREIKYFEEFKSVIDNLQL